MKSYVYYTVLFQVAFHGMENSEHAENGENINGNHLRIPDNSNSATGLDDRYGGSLG